MSGTKIIIILLVVFAALFAVGLALGSRNKDSDPGEMNWVDRISTAFSPTVDFDSLEGPCINPTAKTFAIQPKRSCQITIPAGKDDVRQLKLTLAGGASVTGRYRAPESSDRLADQKVEFDTGDHRSITLAVVKEQGALTLTCPDKDAPCTIEVK